MRGDHHVRDAGHGPCLGKAAHLAQDAAAADRQHQDARRRILPDEQGWAAQRVQKEQLLQGDSHAETQRAATEAADRSRRHFEDTRSVPGQPQLGVDGPVREP